ncbi:MAG: VRR-NUC domain-containing protein [Lachnospiraceae bacterium]|nr:VRR-NUC domain-containing protein [Lachnospiraceae bacterium]
MERERDIEGYMRLKLKQQGALFLKWVSPGNNGVPDRIAIFPSGEIWFVELKADGGALTKLQKHWGRVLLAHRCNTIIITGMEQAKAWLENHEKSTFKAWEEAEHAVQSAQLSTESD